MRVTLDDGSITELSADLAREMQRPDGARMRVDADGMVERFDALGRLAEEIDIDGYRRTYSQQPDGTVRVTHSGGRVDTLRADQTLQSVDWTDGTTYHYGLDGTTLIRMTSLSGGDVTIHPDGSLDVIGPNGFHSTVAADGAIATVDASGNQVQSSFDAVTHEVTYKDPTGAWTEYRFTASLVLERLGAGGGMRERVFASGARDVWQPFGTVQHRAANGDVTGLDVQEGPSTYAASREIDNTWRVDLPGGTVRRYRTDGTLTAIDFSNGAHETYDTQWRLASRVDPFGPSFTNVWVEDGSRTATYTDGRQEVFSPAGQRLREILTSGITRELAPDGVTVVEEHAASGARVEYHADGSRTIQAPNGYAAEVSAVGAVSGANAQGQFVPTTYDPATGDVAWLDAGATRVEYRLFAGLTFERLDAGGAVVERVRPDNSRDVRRPDGSTASLSAGGTVLSISIPDGPSPLLATHEPDGTWSAQLSTGEHRTWRAEGTPASVDFPDGNHEEYDTQGRVVLRRDPGGMTTTIAYNPDATRTETRDDGEVTTFRAGSTLARTQHPNGVTEDFAPDGQTLTRISTLSGLAIDFLPDGSRTAALPNGWHATVAADGTATASDAQGAPVAAVFDPQAQVTTFGDPPQFRLQPDFAWETLDPQGFLQERLTANGWREVWRLDGSRATFDAGAAVQSLVFSELQATHEVDGTWTLQLPSGERRAWRADGMLVSVDFPDGSHQEYDAQWRVVLRRDPGGMTTTVAYDPDGTRTETRDDGERWTFRADNTLARTQHPGGVTEDFGPDGTTLTRRSTLSGVTLDYPTGSVRPASTAPMAHTHYAYAPDGTWTLSFRTADDFETQVEGHAADGALLWTRVNDADGAYAITFPDGRVDHHRADGTLVVRHLPDGTEQYYGLDGVRLTRVNLPDGRHDLYTWLEDGGYTASERDAQDAELRLLAYAGDGALLWTRVPGPDGTSTVTHADGTVDDFRADATLAGRSLPDGTHQLYLADGIRLDRIDRPDGSRDEFAYTESGWEVLTFTPENFLARREAHASDGGLLWTNDYAPDGTWFVTFPSGQRE